MHRLQAELQIRNCVIATDFGESKLPVESSGDFLKVTLFMAACKSTESKSHGTKV
jgi:hypothetical protein